MKLMLLTLFIYVVVIWPLYVKSHNSEIPPHESPNTGSRWQDHGNEDVEPDPCNTGDKLDRILAGDGAADERRNCKGGVE